MKIFNKQIAVTRAQYLFLITAYAGYVMHRKTKDFYFIKVVAPGKTSQIKNYLGFE